MSRDQLRQIIAEYVDSIETGESDKVCRCVWEDLPGNVKGRKKLIDVSFDCPVHTKEGLILDFLVKSKLDIRDVVPSGRAITVGERPAVDSYITKADDRDGKSW